VNLENRFFEMFSYEIITIHKQLSGSTSTIPDTSEVEITFYDVFAHVIGMLLLITASKTN